MLHPDRRTHTRAVWTALLVTVLWSSSWVLIRVGLDDDLPPITFAGLRYALAAGLLAGWALSRSTTRAELGSLPARGWWMLIVLGVVFYAVTQGAQFVAIDAQPAATTSLMLAPTPVLVALLAQRSIGERVRPRQIVGGSLMALGAGVFFAGELGATVVGMIAATIALAANVTSSLLGRFVNRAPHVSPLTVTAVSMTIGAIILLGVGLAIDGLPRLGWTSAAVVAWLAVVNTAWAFTMWNASLRYLAAVESAAINNTMLVQIALLAWVFLGEPPGAAGAIGIAIVSAGAFLAQAADRPGNEAD